MNRVVFDSVDLAPQKAAGDEEPEETKQNGDEKKEDGPKQTPETETTISGPNNQYSHPSDCDND